MVTIVSAFVNRYNKSSETYISYLKRGKDLLRLEQPKVVFIDEDVYNEIIEFENDKTKIIKIKKTDLYLNEYIKSLTADHIITNNPTKDTIEYFTFMCNKTEWIREAIKLNYFHTDQFIWIDFGITQFPKLKEHFEKSPHLPFINKEYNKVRIGGIWDLSNPPVEIYRRINWFFAGGIFGGNYRILISFADLMKSKSIELCNKGILTWEVNIWYLIWKENPNLFDRYICNHNESIVFNY